ncbi:hypothetical protein [Alteromonas sp. A079]|uniref:hypothetical protein n=1 Tax=Alteromonas sp. A079 TaxID=3410268 RepID=UPI003BA2BB33
MDLLTTVFGFWLFIFNKMFREAWVHEYRKSNAFFKIFHLVESFFSMLIGLGIPVFVVYFLIVSG